MPRRRNRREARGYGGLVTKVMNVVSFWGPFLGAVNGDVLASSDYAAADSMGRVKMIADNTLSRLTGFSVFGSSNVPAYRPVHFKLDQVLGGSTKDFLAVAIYGEAGKYIKKHSGISLPMHGLARRVGWRATAGSVLGRGLDDPVALPNNSGIQDTAKVAARPAWANNYV